jgi:uncharacterized membrane protein YjjP (DUF1212 family)
MRQIISSVYGALLIAIWIGVMGTVIAVLDSGEPKWLLVVAGFVAATITVTLVQEFIEWRSRPSDPPPLKWSDLRYVFDIKEDCNGKEAIQA